MIISEEIVKKIEMLSSEFATETGGIIGSRSGDEIDCAVPDKGAACDRISYTPDIRFLNAELERWAQNNIEFRGLFHSHFYGVTDLSEYDREYITVIIKAMPDSVKLLYFPIFVLPQKEMVGYRAERINGTEVLIAKEKVIIV